LASDPIKLLKISVRGNPDSGSAQRAEAQGGQGPGVPRGWRASTQGLRHEPAHLGPSSGCHGSNVSWNHPELAI
jgi:hypothetical protein